MGEIHSLSKYSFKAFTLVSYAHVESLFPALVKSEKLQKSHAEMIDSLKENVYVSNGRRDRGLIVRD